MGAIYKGKAIKKTKSGFETLGTVFPTLERATLAIDSTTL